MDVDFFGRVARILLSENIVIAGGPCGDPVRGENLDGRYVYLLSAMHVVSRRVNEDEWTLLSLNRAFDHIEVYRPEPLWSV